MVTKEDWEKIARKSKICTILALALLFLGVALYYIIYSCCDIVEIYNYKFNVLSIPCVLFFTSGLLFGLSTLDERLAKEYESSTGERW